MTQFEDEVQARIAALGNDAQLREAASAFMKASTVPKYSYNFAALGRPIIQYPQDIVAMQELIWAVRPDLIIEAGVAHGGSLVLSAASLAMLDYTDAIEKHELLDPRVSRRRVIGIDVDIRSHNRLAIESHPLAHKIHLIEGSSIDPRTIEKVSQLAVGFDTVMVILDSNHTHDHVLAELEAYAPLTSKGSYCVVFDTIVEDLPEGTYPDRPWGPGDNPKTAVWEYLRRLGEGTTKAADGDALAFEIDRRIENKLLITVAPDGYLRRI